NGPLLNGVTLVAGLGAHLQQAIAYDEALPQLVVNLLRWAPGWWLTLSGEADEDVGIESVSLGATRQRAGEQGDLTGVEHTDGVAGLMQGDRQSDPVAASGFENHQGRLGDDTCGGEPLLKGGEAFVALLKRAGL